MAAPSPPPPTPPASDLTDRLLAGRYRLARPIASGGMAEVWEAVDEVLARRVAVKILHRHLAADSSFVDRFRAEAIAAARLSHSSIVSIYDTFCDDGHEAIVMELVRGTTLRTRLDQHGPLTVPECLAIGEQVCDALSVAHRGGLVHRDVKPANILLSDDGRVLVADFGIAKAAEAADITRDGLMVGTAKYVAPEQVEGGPIDARTDIYALGVVLYESLCGRAPFTADSETATALARLQRDPLRLRQIRASVPRSVETVVLRALAREPAGRFPDAASFRAALISAGGASDAPDAGRPYRSADAGRPYPAAQVDRPMGRVRPAPSRRADEAASFVHRERGWLVPTLVIVLVAVALTIAGLLVGHTTVAGKLFDNVRNVAGGKAIQATPDPAVSAIAFDPFGNNGDERNDIASKAVDGDPSSVWQTEQYNNPGFGGLKPGVGLVVSLAKTAELRQVIVTSPTTGWAAQVYATEGNTPTQLAGWDKPIDRHENIGPGQTTFDLHGRKAGAVLIWITQLGPHGLVQVGDVKVTGVNPG
ncbi:MAG: protein kinase [Actinomycetota bacterium]|nr:protein kinase [Actinomycetota bacterium]